MKKLLLLGSIALVASACSGDDKKQLFTPKPECKGDAITPYAGTFPQVISTLSIGTVQDGFDLDGDGKPDNKLAAVGSLAKDAIDSSIKNTEIVIPIEFFDLASVAADTCVKFAIYLGISDADGDGKKPTQHGGDCNDHDAMIAPGMPEIAGNFKDDNCNGLADEDGSGAANTTETADMDGDGQSVAQGDCDDTNPMVKKGATEICGDGLDNDCDGTADRTEDAMGNSIACNPFDSTMPIDIALDPLSLDGGQPVISFTSGAIDKNNKLTAGPGTFSVNIPVTDGITLDLKISGATIEGQMQPDGTVMNGRLGGVIDAKTADTIRGLNVSQIGLTPDNSLLDATFANLLGPLLALPKSSAKVDKDYPGCRTPDIDVDGDGLESFCDSNPNDDVKTVDVCIDGDGTVVKDEVGADGTVTKQCSEAVDKNGKPRFVDGISVELNFTTSKIKAIKPPVTQ
jgi:hypothetical protein